MKPTQNSKHDSISISAYGTNCRVLMEATQLLGSMVMVKPSKSSHMMSLGRVQRLLQISS